MAHLPEETETTQFLRALEQVLRTPGFCAPRAAFIEPAVAAQLFCRVQGSNAFRLLRFTDYYFFYAWDAVQTSDEAGRLQELHELGREFANEEYRLPKLLRIAIPNIVSVAVATRALSPAVLDLARRRTFQPGGGEAQQIMAIQVRSRQVFSQGPNHVRGMSFPEIDPLNRAQALVQRAVAGIL